MPPYRIQSQLHYYWYDPLTAKFFMCPEKDIPDEPDKTNAESNKKLLDEITAELNDLLEERGFLFTYDICKAFDLKNQPNKYEFHSGDWKLWMIHILQEKIRLLGLRRMHEENQSPSRYINEIDKNLEQIREAITAFHQKRPAE